MTNTHLGLLRHGQTDWNINFLLQGVTDIPMNQTGIEQVKLAAQAIRAEDWDVVLTSPLSRARQTAEIIASQHGYTEIIEQELLIERSFGEAEGLSHEQWRSKYSNLDVIPGGESRTQLAERSMLLLETISQELAGKRVLAISHGALIRALIAIASNNELPRDGERLGNASLNVVKHIDNSWQVVNYSLEPLVP
ncbi:phoE Broad specificity phosphatase PhoE and related phosphatases [Microbacteriaceae bacterium]